MQNMKQLDVQYPHMSRQISRYTITQATYPLQNSNHELLYSSADTIYCYSNVLLAKIDLFTKKRFKGKLLVLHHFVRPRFCRGRQHFRPSCPYRSVPCTFNNMVKMSWTRRNVKHGIQKTLFIPGSEHYFCLVARLCLLRKF